MMELRKTDEYINQTELPQVKESAKKRNDSVVTSNIAFFTGATFIFGCSLWQQNSLPLSSHHATLIASTTFIATITTILLRDREKLISGAIGIMTGVITTIAMPLICGK